MRRYRITLAGRTYDVRVLGDPRQQQVQVEVDGETLTVEVRPAPIDEAPAAEASPTAVPFPAAEASPRQEATSTVGTVTAPLPGVIKTISVRAGQRVAASDELLVIEAMKMDNVIRAPRDGVIGTIHVSEGRQVAYGEPLVAYE
jgi:biotin carboxyl carrier protein